MIRNYLIFIILIFFSNRNYSQNVGNIEEKLGIPIEIIHKYDTIYNIQNYKFAFITLKSDSLIYAIKAGQYDSIYKEYLNQKNNINRNILTQKKESFIWLYNILKNCNNFPKPIIIEETIINRYDSVTISSLKIILKYDLCDFGCKETINSTNIIFSINNIEKIEEWEIEFYDCKFREKMKDFWEILPPLDE